MKLIKKIALKIPLIFMLVLIFIGAGFGYAFIKDISYRKGLIEVYENSDTIVIATLVRSYSFGSGSKTNYYLWYVYIDEDGKHYEGKYKPHALETRAEAEAYVGTTIEIKIYNGKSYPADYGYPSHLGYQYIVAPLFFSIALFAMILIPVRVKALKNEGKLTAKRLFFSFDLE